MKLLILQQYICIFSKAFGLSLERIKRCNIGVVAETTLGRLSQRKEGRREGKQEGRKEGKKGEKNRWQGREGGRGERKKNNSLGNCL